MSKLHKFGGKYAKHITFADDITNVTLMLAVILSVIVGTIVMSINPINSTAQYYVFPSAIATFVVVMIISISIVGGHKMNVSDYKPIESCQVVGLEHIYESVFGLIDNGKFVEVGAYDGKEWSNTYQLAELGWEGLYIEPVQHLYDACVANHNKHAMVQCVNAFVSDIENVEQHIWKWGPNTYSGNKKFIDGISNGEHVQEVGTCNTIRLNTILEWYFLPQNFELLVIDVEGHELEVLKGFNIDYWMPKMVIIETHAQSTDAHLNYNAKDIDEYFVEFGYKCIYADSINSIYTIDN